MDELESKTITTQRPENFWPKPLPERSEGLHPSPEQYFIRRVRMSEDHPFWELFNS